MSKVSYSKCDHCGAEAHKGGIGEGNVAAVQIDIVLPLAATGHTRLLNDPDLCDGCQQDLLVAVSKWLEPKGEA